MTINCIYIHRHTYKVHINISQFSTMHKKRWRVSVISLPNYFKLCDILSFFLLMFLLFIFILRMTRIISIIFVVSGCCIRTLSHVNRHKSLTRVLLTKLNLKRAMVFFLVYTFCHSNYNNNNNERKIFLTFDFKLVLKNKNYLRENLSYFMCVLLASNCFVNCIYNPIKRKSNMTVKALRSYRVLQLFQSQMKIRKAC